MGLFSKLKDKIAEQKETQRLWTERKAKEAEDDARRPSTTTIPFSKLDSSMPNIIALKEKKIEKKYANDIAEFLACVDEGRAEYTEAMVVSQEQHCVEEKENIPLSGSSDNIDRYYRYYVKIADLNGTVYRELVLTTKKDLVKEWKKTVDWQKAENPDIVTDTDYPRVYVLHYYLGDEEFYLALDKAEFDNIASIANKIRFKTNQGVKCLELNRYNLFCCFW